MLADSTHSFLEDDSLLSNPFFESSVDGHSTSSSPGNTHAHLSSATRRPVQGLRSRGLGSIRTSNEVGIHGHLRFKTEILSSPGASGSGHHPLRHNGPPTNLDDAGITRPHLSRIVEVGNLVDAPLVESRVIQGLSSGLPRFEQNVLVHDVLPTDSLAGVALRYGIPLADLRRANHLWASDPIHLRKVLFIPVEKASRAQEFMSDPNLISLSSSIDEEILDPFETPGTRVDASDKSHDIPPPVPFGTGTFRRIPASEMSFFPPPSTTQVEQPTRASPKSVPAYATISKSYSAHLRATSSPSLASILTALPITPSTRDNLIARLSFESVSSSYSDHDTDDGSEGHELERVGQTRHLPFPNSPDFSDPRSPSVATPKPAPHVPSTVGSTPPSPKQSRGRSHPHSEIHPAIQHPRVRTAQMEPSPVMQLPPLRASKGKGRQRGSLINDVELDIAR